jgi:hypothetical protein
MVDTTLIREHMPVVDCRGEPIGTVDHLDAGRIKLTRTGSPDGQHHFIPLSQISMVDDDKVTTQTTLEETLALMRSGAQESHQEG